MQDMYEKICNTYEIQYFQISLEKCGKSAVLKSLAVSYSAAQTG